MLIEFVELRALSITHSEEGDNDCVKDDEASATIRLVGRLVARP